MFDEIIFRNDTKIFVAEEGDKLMGLATLYILPNIRHGWHRGHIEDFFVSEGVRSNGIGTQIFITVKKFCHDNLIRVIKLDSANDLTKAHKFYMKNGGKQTEKMFRFDID
jgi:GNAT superfamily N-acetyltransferase